jgi:cellulose synthase operon protein C
MKRYLLAAIISSALMGCNQADPKESLAKGAAQYQAGDYKSSVLEYKNVLQQEKENALARFGLAKNYFQLHDYLNAGKELERALEYGQPLSDIAIWQARVYDRTEKGVLLSGMSHHNDLEIAFYQLKEARASGDKTKVKALQSWASTQGGNGDNVGFKTLFAAEQSFNDKQYDNVLSLLKIDATPDLMEFESWQMLRVDSALFSNKPELATQALMVMYKANPNNVQKAFQLAHILVRIQKFEQAKPIVERLLSANPDNGLLNELSAVVLYNEKNYDGAISAARISAIQQPNSPMTRLIAAYSAEQLGQHKQALDNLEFIIDKLPPSHPAQRLYIKLKAGAGDTDGLSERALALGELGAEDVALLSSVGLEMVRTGQLDKAEALATKAAELHTGGESGAALGLLQLSLRNKGAFDTLEESFAQSPDSLIVGNSLASAYLADKRYDDALQLANTWKGDGTHAVQGLMLEGVVYARQEQHANALRAFNEVLKKDPSHIMATAAKIESLVTQGQVGRAESLVNSSVSQEGGVLFLRHYLSAQRTNGDFLAGVSFSEALFERHENLRNDPQSVMVLGQAIFLTKQWQKAIELLSPHEQALSSGNGFWLVVSTSYVQLGNKEKALDTYRNWLRKQPESPMALMGAIRMHAGMGDNKSALALLDTQAKYHKDKTPIELLRVNFMILNQQWTEAKRTFKRLPVDVKQSISAQGMAGILAFKEGLFDQTIEQLTPLHDVAPSEQSLRWLVYANQAKKQPYQAKVLLEDFTAKKTSSALAWFMLGNVYLGEENYTLGRDAYLKGNAIVSGNPMLLNNLAYAEWKLGDYLSAKAHVETALGKMKNRPELVDTLANILLDMGRSDKALLVMEASLAEFPTTTSDDFGMTFVRVLLKKSQNDRAKTFVAKHKWKSAQVKQQAENLLNG